MINVTIPESENPLVTIGRRAGYAVRDLSKVLIEPLNNSDAVYQGIKTADENASGRKPDRTRLYIAGGVVVLAALAAGEIYFGFPITKNVGSSIASSISSNSPTSSPTSASTSNELVDLLIQPFHDYNFDRIQQPEDPILDKLIIQLGMVEDNTFSQIIQEDKKGQYWARNIPKGDNYNYTVQLLNQQKDGTYVKDTKFPWIATSPDNQQDFLNFGYGDFLKLADFTFKVTSKEPTLPLPFGEGFLTYEVKPQTKFYIGDFYDRDPDPDKFLFWNGQKGSQDDAPGMTWGIRNVNHQGRDLQFDNLNEPLVAQASGIPSWIGEDSIGKFIWIKHRYGFTTSSGHITKATVVEGTPVNRGNVVALSGALHTGQKMNHQQLELNDTIMLDLFQPDFSIDSQYAGYYDYSSGTKKWKSSSIDSSNPNMHNYWTEFNHPHFSL